MGNILNYIQWRGDLDFLRDPFNDIDALIVSLITYLPFKDIVPGIGSSEEITLQEAARQFFSKFPSEIKKSEVIDSSATSSFDIEIAKLLRNISSCPRFENMRLSSFEENTDFIKEQQFAAMTYSMQNPEFKKVIAFRGTDNSLVGWKEDFKLSYMEQIPAQESACSYLGSTIGIFSPHFIVCGHSKGGNLAMYAGCHLKPVPQMKLKKIINFDGPGFDFSIVRRNPFLRYQHKVINYVPEESMVGLLLESIGKRVVIASADRFIKQHDALNWEVERSEFISGELSGSAILLEQILKTWLTEITISDREMFLEALFDILGASEGKVINQDPKESLQDIKEIFKKYSKLDSKTKTLLAQVFGSLAAEAGKTISGELKVRIPHNLPGRKNTNLTKRKNMQTK